jgi:CRP-like cAMP-binding protein
MALEHDMAVLARVPMFATLGDEQLRLIAFGAEPYELLKGRRLCRAGDMADGAFVLTSGTLGRLAGDDDQDDQIERSFSEPGTLIGEIPLLTRCEWQSTIIAQTQCRLLRLPRPLFRRILDEYPNTALDIKERMTADLSAKVRLMEVVAKKLS